MGITLVEALLVIGTFGICTGVWVTLKVIINQGKGSDSLTCRCEDLESVPMTITECSAVSIDSVLKKEESN